MIRSLSRVVLTGLAAIGPALAQTPGDQTPGDQTPGAQTPGAQTPGAGPADVGAADPGASWTQTALSQPQDWEARLDVVFLASGADSQDPGVAQPGPLMGSALLSLSREDTLDSGLTLNWRLAGRYEQDARARPAFAGVLGACPVSVSDCAGVGGRLPVSPQTGLSAGGPPPGTSGFLALETASLSLLSGWGETVLGFDAGVAARLDARPPGLMQRASVLSTGLDPTGLSMIRARNDVTGASAKVSYMTPRWLGIRAGASFTPEANLRSADYDPQPDGPGRLTAGLREVWEGALSFARQFPDSDLRVRAALTYSHARASAGQTVFGDYEAWGAGLELETGAWSGGLRWLAGDNARPGASGTYEAVEAGLVRQEGNWRIGLEAGWARDKLTLTEGTSWLAGVGWQANERLALSLGWASSQADSPFSLGSGLGVRRVGQSGPVFEVSVRN